jgi:hypothetical protein
MQLEDLIVRMHGSAGGTPELGQIGIVGLGSWSGCPPRSRVLSTSLWSLPPGT